MANASGQCLFRIDIDLRKRSRSFGESIRMASLADRQQNMFVPQYTNYQAVYNEIAQ